jgi:hypothetical protein
MASDVLTIVYEHRCTKDGENCSRHGERIPIKPSCTDGVALVVRPECIETGRQLVEVGRQRE